MALDNHLRLSAENPGLPVALSIETVGLGSGCHIKCEPVPPVAQRRAGIHAPGIRIVRADSLVGNQDTIPSVPSHSYMIQYSRVTISDINACSSLVINNYIAQSYLACTIGLVRIPDDNAVGGAGAYDRREAKISENGIVGSALDMNSSHIGGFFQNRARSAGSIPVSIARTFNCEPSGNQDLLSKKKNPAGEAKAAVCRLNGLYRGLNGVCVVMLSITDREIRSLLYINRPRSWRHTAISPGLCLHGNHPQ
jgi:hypothetical protein